MSFTKIKIPFLHIGTPVLPTLFLACTIRDANCWICIKETPPLVRMKHDGCVNGTIVCHEMFWTEAYNVLMHVYPEQYFEQYKDFFFQMLLIKTIYFGFYTLLNTIYFTMHFNIILFFCKKRRYKFPK